MLETNSKSLTKSRKARKNKLTSIPRDDLQEFSHQHKLGPIHQKSGVSTLAANKLLALATKDGSISISNKESILSKVDKAHGGKKITSLAWMGSHLISGGLDKQVRFWDTKDGLVAKWALKDLDEVVSVASHPSGEYILACDASKVIIVDLHGKVVDSFDTASVLHSMRVHPDGMLLAAGTDDGTKIWELKGYTAVGTLSGPPSSIISFAENGYSVATSNGDGVKVWDLRKLGQAAVDLAVSKVHDVSWDETASYLAIATGHDVWYIFIIGTNV